MFVAIGIHFEVKKTSNELTTTFHQVQFPLRKWMVKVYQKTKCQGWGLGVGEFSKEQVLSLFLLAFIWLFNLSFNYSPACLSKETIQPP